MANHPAYFFFKKFLFQERKVCYITQGKWQPTRWKLKAQTVLVASDSIGKKTRIFLASTLNHFSNHCDLQDDLFIEFSLQTALEGFLYCQDSQDYLSVQSSLLKQIRCHNCFLLENQLMSAQCLYTLHSWRMQKPKQLFF